MFATRGTANSGLYTLKTNKSEVEKMNRREKTDKIFTYFEDNIFKDEGEHRRTYNLLFAFSDWIDTQAGQESILEEFAPDEVEGVTAEFNKGIDIFFDEIKDSCSFLF